MNSPTHETVAQRAYQLWQERGCPADCDTEIWLEAERQLSADDSASPPSKATSTARLKADTAAESNDEYHLPSVMPDEEAIKAAVKKHEARAPILPHTSAPKQKPPESGKPLYSKPHSA